MSPRTRVPTASSGAGVIVVDVPSMRVPLGKDASGERHIQQQHVYGEVPCTNDRTPKGTATATQPPGHQLQESHRQQGDQLPCQVKGQAGGHDAKARAMWASPKNDLSLQASKQMEKPLQQRMGLIQKLAFARTLRHAAMMELFKLHICTTMAWRPLRALPHARPEFNAEVDEGGPEQPRGVRELQV